MFYNLTSHIEEETNPLRKLDNLEKVHILLPTTTTSPYLNMKSLTFYKNICYRIILD